MEQDTKMEVARTDGGAVIKRPNYLLDIPADEYHAATKRGEYLTSHRLAIFRKCPAEFRKVETGEIVEGDTRAFALGAATHTAVIEPDKFAAEYLVADGPTNPKTGKAYGKDSKAYLDWEAAQEKKVVATADAELITKMRDAVRAHEAAADILSAGFAEGTIRTDWCGMPVQARLDWYDPERNLIADLKTCADIDRFFFDLRDFGYVYQLAFYAKLVHKARGKKEMSLPDCFLIAVEKKEPFRVQVIHPFEMTITDALQFKVADGGRRIDCETMMAELAECRRTDKWPTRTEDVIRF